MQWLPLGSFPQSKILSMVGRKKEQKQRTKEGKKGTKYWRKSSSKEMDKSFGK